MIDIQNVNLTFYMCLLVVICFGFIHFLEYASFLSRISGIITGAKVTSYTVQQSTFVITRFFFVAMMPVIGLIVDMQVVNESYLLMVHTSLFLAAFFYLVVLLYGNLLTRYFSNVILNYKDSGVLIKSLLSLKNWSGTDSDFKNIIKNSVIYIKNSKEGIRLFLGSSIVFCCYSLGVFMSFYLALNYYDYRSSIGQLSGLVNAFATVLLTFYIEPKISIAIDNEEDLAKEKVIVLLLGRLFGLVFLAQFLVMSLWLLL